MTGWWQITGRSAKEPSLRAEDDIYYARNYSFLLDLQILFRTIGAVIRGEGAY
jgi:lipopolysaccharide/colanic/teichoic acid biosynthesis glycosyltransferase